MNLSDEDIVDRYLSVGIRHRTSAKEFSGDGEWGYSVRRPRSPNSHWQVIAQQPSPIQLALLFIDLALGPDGDTDTTREIWQPQDLAITWLPMLSVGLFEIFLAFTKKTIPCSSWGVCVP